MPNYPIEGGNSLCLSFCQDLVVVGQEGIKLFWISNNSKTRYPTVKGHNSVQGCLCALVKFNPFVKWK